MKSMYERLHALQCGDSTGRRRTTQLHDSSSRHFYCFVTFLILSEIFDAVS
jgi:hypothetical protein